MLIKWVDIQCASTYLYKQFLQYQKISYKFCFQFVLQSDAEQEAEKDDAPASPASPSGE